MSAADWLLVGAKSPIALRLRQPVIPPPKFRPGIAARDGSDFPFLKRRRNEQENCVNKWFRTAVDSTHRCGRADCFLSSTCARRPSAVTEVGDMAVDKRKALQPVL